MTQIEKIFDANDKALEEGIGNAQSRLDMMMKRYRLKLVTGKAPPVHAFIDSGRWLAMCECEGGVEYVAEGVPFLCFSCGNEREGGMVRSVIFPKNKSAIETELLKRGIKKGLGLTETHRARKSTPLEKGLSRSWMVGESVRDLKEQRELGFDAYIKKHAEK